MKRNPLTYLARYIAPRRGKAYIEIMLSDFEKTQKNSKFNSRKKSWAWAWTALKLAWKTRVRVIQEKVWIAFFITPKKAITVLGIFLLLTILSALIQKLYLIKVENQKIQQQAEANYQESLTLELIFNADKCLDENKRNINCVSTALNKISGKSFELLSTVAKEKYYDLRNYTKPYTQTFNATNPHQKEIILRHLDIEQNETLTIGHLLEIKEISLESQETLENFFDNLPPEWFTNLQKFNFKDDYSQSRNLNDVSLLSNLINLQSLYLSNTQVSDISPLSNLTNLQSLHLSNTEVKNINPLSNLTDLKELYLYDTEVSDISSLSNLANLQNLYLSNTQVNDISPLSDLINLQNLYLSDTQVSDISPLSDLINLQNLYLSDTQVSDIKPLSNLVNLRNLNLYNTQVNDIDSLSKLTNLEYISLNGTKINDTNPLLNLKKLHTIHHNIFPLASNAGKNTNEQPAKEYIINSYCSKPFDLNGRNLESLLEILRKNYKFLYSYSGIAAPHGILYQKLEFDANNPNNNKILEGMTISVQTQIDYNVESDTHWNLFSNLIYPTLSDIPLDKLNNLIEKSDKDIKIRVINLDVEDNKGDGDNYGVGYTFETLPSEHLIENGQIKFHFKRLPDNKADFCSEITIDKIKSEEAGWEPIFIPLKMPIPLPDHDTNYNTNINFSEGQVKEISLREIAASYHWSNLAYKVRKEIGIENGKNLPFPNNPQNSKW